jgi:hypothetical protein
MRQKRKRRLFSRLHLDTSVGVGVSASCDVRYGLPRRLSGSGQAIRTRRLQQSDNGGVGTHPIPWGLRKWAGCSERPKTRAAGGCVPPGSSGRSQGNVNRLRALKRDGSIPGLIAAWAGTNLRNGGMVPLCPSQELTTLSLMGQKKIRIGGGNACKMLV